MYHPIHGFNGLNDKSFILHRWKSLALSKRPQNQLLDLFPPFRVNNVVHITRQINKKHTHCKVSTHEPFYIVQRDIERASILQFITPQL